MYSIGNVGKTTLTSMITLFEPIYMYNNQPRYNNQVSAKYIVINEKMCH